MNQTGIEWTNKTWNPVTGCNNISAGCRFCYARMMAWRLRGRYGYDHMSPFSVTTHNNRLDEPFNYKKSRLIFVCSMGDLFHSKIPHTFRIQIFARMAANPRHTFLVLTKRTQEMYEFYALLNTLVKRTYFKRGTKYKGPHISFLMQNLMENQIPDNVNELTWPLQNVWLGATAETQPMLDYRAQALLRTPAKLHFLSVEPCLEEIDLTNVVFRAGDDFYKVNVLTGKGLKDTRGGLVDDGYQLPNSIKWIICGGETGNSSDVRWMHPLWARKLRDDCARAGVPFFFKQWGKWIPVEDTGDKMLDQDGTLYNKSEIYNEYGSTPWGWYKTRRDYKALNETRTTEFRRRWRRTPKVRTLDGKSYNEYPDILNISQ